MTSRLRISALACTAFVALAPALSGQAAGPQPEVAPVALARAGHVDAVAAADALYFDGKVEEAFALLNEHLEAHPTDYEALWRAARAGVVAGVLREGITSQNERLDPAIVLGDRAVAERPDGVDGLYWRGAAEGRRALNAGSDYAARLVQRVYDDAHAILALDSLHGGAYNLLGRVNYEIMDLPRIARFFARRLVGNQAIRDSNWEDAEVFLTRAAELWPDNVLFQLDLGDLYQRRGRDDEARVQLARVVEMPSVHPADEYFKESARRFLEELGS
ncbi:MAG: tetratricopeptide repeat protein [Gemmatimonadales bacterium]